MLAKSPKQRDAQANLMLEAVPYAETRAEAELLWRVFARRRVEPWYRTAAKPLERD